MKKILIKYGLSSFKDWIQFIGGIIATLFLVSFFYMVFDLVWSEKHNFISAKITISTFTLFVMWLFVEKVYQKLNP